MVQHLVHFDPIWSTWVLFGLFGPLALFRSTSVHFGPPWSNLDNFSLQCTHSRMGKDKFELRVISII